MTTWHHAYNGIPTVKDWHAVGRNGFVGNRPPSGHDYLRPNDLSGELRVSLTVVSPTVPGQGTKDGRVVVASRSGATGGTTNWDDVSIPVSTLKGVLSSAYEAVTASRMRVFAGHDHVLTHRRTTQESAILYPVFLVPDPGARKGTGLRARIMLGKNPRLKPGQWEEPPYLCAVVLPNSENSRTSLYDNRGRLYSGAVKQKDRWRRRGTDEQDVTARLSRLRAATPHLSRITFTMQEEKFYQTKRLIVASINGERFCGATKRGSKTNGRSYTGYVVRLTPEGSDPLIDTKHNEFIFFDNDQNRTYREVSERVLAGLVEVIHSYLENIRTLKRQEARRHEAGAPDESKTRRSDAPNTWLIHSILDTSHGGPGLSADREAIEQYLRRLAAADPGVPPLRLHRLHGHDHRTLPVPGGQTRQQRRAHARGAGRGRRYHPSAGLCRGLPCGPHVGLRRRHQGRGAGPGSGSTRTHHDPPDHPSSAARGRELAQVAGGRQHGLDPADAGQPEAIDRRAVPPWEER